MFNNISTDNSTTLLSFPLHFFFMRDWCRCWSRAVLLKHTKQGDAQECPTLSLFKQSEESQQRGSWVQWRVSDWCCLVRSCLGFFFVVWKHSPGAQDCSNHNLPENTGERFSQIFPPIHALPRASVNDLEDDFNYFNNCDCDYFFFHFSPEQISQYSASISIAKSHYSRWLQ